MNSTLSLLAVPQGNSYSNSVCFLTHRTLQQHSLLQLVTNGGLTRRGLGLTRKGLGLFPERVAILGFSPDLLKAVGVFQNLVDSIVCLGFNNHSLGLFFKFLAQVGFGNGRTVVAVA